MYSTQGTPGRSKPLEAMSPAAMCRVGRLWYVMKSPTGVVYFPLRRLPPVEMRVAKTILSVLVSQQQLIIQTHLDAFVLVWEHLEITEPAPRSK